MQVILTTAFKECEGFNYTVINVINTVFVTEINAKLTEKLSRIE